MKARSGLQSAWVAVLLVAPLGFACATGLRQLRGWQRGLAELAVLSPLVLPPTVVGFILLQLLGRYGPMGGLLGHVGSYSQSTGTGLVSGSSGFRLLRFARIPLADNAGAKSSQCLV
jgi:ABC-type molybdate transport system permease subunit